jgi:hypothetical protein
VWAVPFWEVDDDDDDDEEEEDSNVGITKDEAIRFVDGLESVSVDQEGFPPHCIVFWSEWAETQSEDTCVPVRLPAVVDILWVVIAL